MKAKDLAGLLGALPPKAEVTIFNRHLAIVIDGEQVRPIVKCDPSEMAQSFEGRVRRAVGDIVSLNTPEETPAPEPEPEPETAA